MYTNLYNIIPKEYAEKINDSEIILFELMHICNKKNVDDIIQITSEIISERPTLKHIIEKYANQKHKMTKPYEKYFDAFNITHSSIPIDEKIFSDDDIEKFQMECINKEYSWDMIRNSIEHESMKIFKYILLSFNPEIKPFDVYLAICVGNIEIIRIMEQYGINFFEEENLIDIFNSHHFDLISWASLNGYEFPSVEITPSLYFHFMNNIECNYDAIDYDISCLDDDSVIFSDDDLYFFTDRQSRNIIRIYTDNDLSLSIELNNIPKDKKLNPIKAIISDCKNIVFTKPFKFNLMDLAVSIRYNKKEIFEYILSKVQITNEPIGITGMNILQISIVNGDIFFIEKIIQSKSFEKHLLFLNDSFENNIFHYSMRQDSKEIFLLLKNNVPEEEFIKMIQYKNNDRESPYDLAIKYEHDFL